MTNAPLLGRRDHNYRDISALADFPKGFDEAETVKFGHLIVYDHQIGVVVRAPP
jgi:hypothetical protein